MVREKLVSPREQNAEGKEVSHVSSSPVELDAES